MGRSLTNVYINEAGSGTNKLENGSGECEDRIVTVSGDVLNNGPVLNGTYIIISKEKRYYDIKCIAANDGYYSFTLREGDEC